MGEEIKGSECLGTGQDYQSDSPAGIAAAATAALLQLHHFHFHLGFPSAAAAAVPRDLWQSRISCLGGECMSACVFALFSSVYIERIIFAYIFTHFRALPCTFDWVCFFFIRLRFLHFARISTPKKKNQEWVQKAPPSAADPSGPGKGKGEGKGEGAGSRSRSRSRRSPSSPHGQKFSLCHFSFSLVLVLPHCRPWFYTLGENLESQ